MDLKTIVGEINLLYPFLVLITLLFFIFKHISLKGPPLPPGPYPLPIIGNILQLAGKQLHVAVTNLAEIHGPLISLRLGTQLLIVGSSPAVATEILKTHDRILSGRSVPHAHVAKSPKSNHLSLAFAYECNDQWKYLRAVCRAEIFSTKALDSQVNLREKVVMEMVEFLGSKEGQVVVIGEIVFAAVFNMLANTIFSMDFIDSEGKGVGAQMKELTRRIAQFLSAPNVSDLYPILSRFDVQGIGKKNLQVNKKICDIWEDIIEERRKKRSEVSSQRDFLDALFETGLSNDQINQLILELLTAGTETTSTNIEWVMAELLKNKDAMDKLRKELVHDIGEDIVRESHLPHLPYLQACVKETLRLHSPAPFLLPHRALETCQVMGYSIPKDSQVIVNMWAIGRDPTIWDDPLSFKPERFLNSELDFKGNDFEFTPFGAGRRICPGLPLVVREVPLIIASLIHMFDWVLPNDMVPAELDMNEKFTISLQMEQPLQVIPKARNS